MARPQITLERARELMEKFPRRRLIVLGDLMLDEFIWGKASRISPEAPVPIVEVERESVKLGGAGNVISNLVCLGAQGFPIGVVGPDEAAERLRSELKNLHVDSTGIIVDPSRRTTVKTRIIAHNQQVLRTDRESRAAVSEEVGEHLVMAFMSLAGAAEGVIISDYDKGTITPHVLRHVLAFSQEKGLPVFLDPKIRNFTHYSPVTLLKPNEREAERVTNKEITNEEDLIAAGREIMDLVSCDHLLITRGERGMTLFSREGDIHHLPTVAREVYDVTGAGDTVMAVVALSFTSGATPLEAAILANYAASVVIAKVGTAAANRDEILKAIETDRIARESITN